MFLAIAIILSMSFVDLSRLTGIQFRPFRKMIFFIFVFNLLILLQLGAKHVESPYIEFGQICTIFYFGYFLILVPFVNYLEKSFDFQLFKNKILKFINIFNLKQTFALE